MSIVSGVLQASVPVEVGIGGVVEDSVEGEEVLVTVEAEEVLVVEEEAVLVTGEEEGVSEDEVRTN